MDAQIMGLKETAQYLNIKEQTAYKLLQQNKLPALKIGGQWKVKKEHLDKMFDEMLQSSLENMKK
ncbi:MAG: helix-turn-helix domain-containing protein [Candidatus Marinimicrobia bacterium]|nr:helix-turn-helix domain-containing protein [Candidatus Neomarinimicrobiota bacterium]